MPSQERPFGPCTAVNVPGKPMLCTQLVHSLYKDPDPTCNTLLNVKQFAVKKQQGLLVLFTANHFDKNSQIRLKWPGILI